MNEPHKLKDLSDLSPVLGIILVTAILVLISPLAALITGGAALASFGALAFVRALRRRPPGNAEK